MEDMINHDTMNIMEDLSTSSSFCKSMNGSGGGMTMYMSGFQSTLIDSSSKTCLNLYVSNWTLDTKFKFLFAMIFVLCLGTSLDGLAWLKRKYLLSLEEKQKKILYNTTTTTNTHQNVDIDCNNDHHHPTMDDNQSYPIVQVKIVLLIFQFLQAFIGYVLMLSAMTYSIELLLSAIFGLTLGCHLFGKHNMMFAQHKRRVTRSSSSRSTTPISSILDQFEESETPCHEISNDTSFFGSSSSSQRRFSMRNNGFDYIAINDNEDVTRIEDRRHDLGDDNDEEKNCCIDTDSF